MSRLIYNLPERFKPLNTAEAKLLDAVQNNDGGEIAVDYRFDKEKDVEIDKPENAVNWGDERTIRADFLVWILTDKTTSKRINAKGIAIFGAKIDGEIDLAFAILPFPFQLNQCSCDKMKLLNSYTEILSFWKSNFNSIFADGMKAKGSLFLRGIKVCGEVNLIGAEIGGQIDCTDSEFYNKNGIAFYADEMKVKGGLALSGVSAQGIVRLLAANIGGQINCINAEFNNENSIAFYADGMTVKGIVSLNKAIFRGDVTLLGTEIGGQLDCTDAKFNNENKKAFHADGMKVKGIVLFKNTICHGEVSLLGAEIDGQLDCTDAKFNNENGKALSADWMKVKSAISFNKAIIHGEVRLICANIGGALICDNAEFKNDNGNAFSADMMKVKGSVYFQGTKAYGVVRLPSADIGAVLACDNAEFNGDLILQNMKVKDDFFMRFVPISVILDLSHAKIGQLVDQRDSWPTKGNLNLIGFEYDSIVWCSPMKAEDRLEWVARQNEEKRFSPQPYEQLAKVYKKMGHESDARKVQYAKHEAIKKYGKLDDIDKFWNWFLGKTIGHGYKPIYALGWMALIIYIGSNFFCLAKLGGIMIPSKERVYMSESYKKYYEPPDEYSRFNALIYSVDTFIPFVNLHQEDYWLPDANTSTCGGLLRIYLWIHIALGWVFSSLLVAVLTGLIKKE